MTVPVLSRTGTGVMVGGAGVGLSVGSGELVGASVAGTGDAVAVTAGCAVSVACGCMVSVATVAAGALVQAVAYMMATIQTSGERRFIPEFL